MKRNSRLNASDPMRNAMITVLSLVLLAGLLVAACGGGDDPAAAETTAAAAITTTTSTTTTTQATTTTLGVLAVELSHAQDHGVKAFAASGAAVEEGVVCPVGTMNEMGLVSMDDEPMTDEDWANTFDSAMAEDGIAEMYVILEWTCSGGSDSFTAKFHNVFDFATFEFEGRQGVGTWEITEGTGSLGDVNGSGDVVLDWDAGMVFYGGQIEI